MTEGVEGRGSTVDSQRDEAMVEGRRVRAVNPRPSTLSVAAEVTRRSMLMMAYNVWRSTLDSRPSTPLLAVGGRPSALDSPSGRRPSTLDRRLFLRPSTPHP